MSPPAVFTIPPHVAFVDALAKGLIERTRGDPMRLARGLVLLPNRRAVRALTEAFVRLSDGGALLLPRMTPIGDVDEDEALGSFADDIDIEGEMLPGVESCERRLLLAQIVRNWSPGIGAVEAMRLGDALARTLDGLGRDGKGAAELLELPPAEVAEHWQASLKFLTLLVEQWPERLALIGKSDRAERANLLVEALTARWLSPSRPDRLVVGAGIVDASPSVAVLLGAVARLPDGLVVLPGLDTDMPDATWKAIRCHLDDAESHARHNSESHPQFGFRCLLARMKVPRGEVETWPWDGGIDGPEARTAAVARAMAPARFTADWVGSALGPDALSGVKFVETATANEEAQVISLALRRQLDRPGKTAALVTPDRGLARRVAGHLARYGVAIDDSAGTPLRVAPPGTLVLALAEAAAQGFAPAPLLAALKHPLVSPEGRDERLAWLDRVRALDLALRGVRPPPGLDNVGGAIDAAINAKRNPADPALADWWDGLSPLLEPLERLFGQRTFGIGALFEKVRVAGEALAGEELWRGPAGRALGDLFTQIGQHEDKLQPIEPADAPELIGAFLQDAAVRPPGRHPRLAIYGLLEARLQRADLMILGGLNEGTWPALPSPDPWLAPSARAGLGLPGLDRRVGLAAHDFVQAMGAPEVLATRARRDEAAPAVPSRFWLRLTALAGEAAVQDAELLGIARALDRCDAPAPASRPAPKPPAEKRPRKLYVTGAEKLKADPYSFYAEQMLGLSKLKPLDEDPTAAERGTFVHNILERWFEDGANLDTLAGYAALRLSEWDHHPLMRALWAPRVERMIDWVGEEMRRWQKQGWTPIRAEARGTVAIGPVSLTGKADRLDRNAEGSLAIVDYKTGGIPSNAQLEGGFSLQLGLLAWMAGQGAFGAPETVAALRYWKLSGGRTEGVAKDPLVHARKSWIEIDDFAERSRRHLQALIDTLLLGDEPFTAKLHPEHATHYTDHDQVARVAEWWGRDAK